jgi:serine/threonine-protein kinase
MRTGAVWAVPLDATIPPGGRPDAKLRAVGDEPIGTIVGDYRIESVLGGGGQGMVYLAEHVHLGRKAALKLLRPELAADPEFRERFIREARLAATLDHPNVLPVYDAGEDHGMLFLAQKLVHGMDLGALVEREGHLRPERAVELLAPVAGALDAAHHRNLVHRDVKPANILIQVASDDDPERVYLSDFGLTKDLVGEQDLSGSGRLTKAGYFVGTPHYAAPEQIESDPIDGRTDQYSLTCVLYQCLTGRVPFPRPSETAVLVAHVVDPPPAPSMVQAGVPSAMDAVIATGMAKSKEARYASCADMVRAARAALAAPPPAPGLPSPPTVPVRPDGAPTAGPPPPPPPPRSESRVRRRRILVGAVAGAVAVAIVAVVLILALGGGGGAFKLGDDEMVVTRFQGKSDDVVVETTTGTTVRNLSNDKAEDFMPSVSRDRTEVAFASNRDGGDDDIFVVNADGTGLRQLTSNANVDIEPAFSPDGSKIAFASNRNGDSDIFVMSADGTDAVDLTNDPGDDETPTWSPDGSQIAFMSNRRDGSTFDVFVMNADGTNQHLFAGGATNDGDPAWSPDGTKIAFSSDRKGTFDIFVRAVGSSEDVPGPATDEADRFPSWSPDGTEIAFARIAADQTSKVVVAPATGGTGTATQDARDERDPSWGT